MKTPEEQQAFFQEHWPELLEAARKSPADAARFVAGFEDPLQRRILFFFSRPGLVFQEWEGKNLDTIVGVAEAGIQEVLAQAASADEDEARNRLTDLANVMSYNLAADLADCWGDDGFERSPAHFAAGLKASEDCVKWREVLEKPAGPRAMAWWAKGMHELSLGRTEDAEASWRRSLAYAEESAEGDDDFGVVLGKGYVGLAEWVGGNAEGKAHLDQACAVFRRQLDDEAKRDDAKVGLDQLEAVKAKYGPAA